MTKEATLAGSFSPAVLAIGAAVITGAVVVGVIAGPGTVACVERGDFGQCMSETFLGAEQEMVAGVGVPTQEPVGEPETAVPDTASQEAETAQTAEPELAAPAVAPSVDLVRVEPDGSAVMAGSATPYGDIQIFANDELIGEETAEPSGDWAFVTDTPLPAGGVELRVFDLTSEQFAETSVVVVVQEDRTSEPLVVASTPGEASNILQGLAAPETPAAEAVPVETAELEESGEPAPAAEPVETAPADMVVAEADQPAAPVEEPDAQMSAEPSEAQGPLEAEPAGDVGQQPADAPVAEQPVDGQASAESESAETVLDVPAEPAEAADIAQPEIAEAVGGVTAEEPAAAPANADAAEETPETAVASAAPAQAAASPDEPALTVVPPTIDAVEIDGDRNFFAGSGTDGFAVRLYVDNAAVGLATVTDGRWLVEAINVLTGESHRIRIDMLNPDGSVASRAEVNFVVNLPQGVVPEAQEQAVADTPAPETAAPDASSGQPAPAAEEPVAAEDADAEQQDLQPSAGAEVGSEESVPTLVGVGDGDRVVSGQAIIRRGDNLWTIARRVYGEGIRYTQIYQANTDQIRDPDLIYPGQVFTLPGTDMQIGGEGEADEG